ncbi:pilus assembly protein PilW [Acinetobacter sp. Root1280]|uniref:PilW family protein n=1 Tax=Acinetobacter sp. Root1280 TaxID=1736444 RepID=UPI0006F4A603|nr:PilW family protein [Acinetobacter sp. Root1280]KQW90462.1 pilus assembly protein PilW [Acinetobacter sp. Root1280]
MIKQKGFTLIELMISLALGLIISAAAILLFLTSGKSLSLQQGVSDIQDNANFGLNYITHDLRLTNLYTDQSVINDATVNGGIVLTSSANPHKDISKTPPLITSNLVSTIEGDTANINLLSRSPGAGVTVGSGDLWTGASNVKESGIDLASDQLVIQYVPIYQLEKRKGVNFWVGGFDCEGKELVFSEADGKQVIVQRYFLRADANAGSSEPNKPLALACDSGHYSADITNNPKSITGFGSAGQIVMKRVDYFRVLLGVQDDALNRRRYYSINDYMNLTSANKPRIVSLQLGMLIRSTQSVGAEATIKNDQQFTVLDKTITVKVPTQNTKYVRQVVSQTVALRNAIGDRQ